MGTITQWAGWAKKLITRENAATEICGRGWSISRRPPDLPRRRRLSIRPPSTMSSQKIIDLISTEPHYTLRDEGDRDFLKSDGASEDEDYLPPKPPER
jgi:hypothetical protein